MILSYQVYNIWKKNKQSLTTQSIWINIDWSKGKRKNRKDGENIYIQKQMSLS